MDVGERRTQIPREFVKMIAEAIGCSNITDAALVDMAEQVTTFIKEVVREARKSMERGCRRRLLCCDIDQALIRKNIEPLYGFSCPDSIPFRFASGGGGRQIFFRDDKDVDLAEVVNSAPPKFPLGIALKTHWLAVEGVQPAVPENPAQVGRLNESEAKSHDMAKKAEMKKYRTKELASVRTVITHEMSVEQQIYFKEVTEACVGADEAKRAEALESLSKDTGLQPMMPRFCLFIVEGVRCNMVQYNLAILIYLMRMIKAIVDNESLNLEKFMHNLLPSVMSCVVSRALCVRPETDNHWALREFAARLLVQICRRYHTDVNGIQTRVLKVLAGAWRDHERAFSALFGVVCAIGEFGMDAVKKMLLPGLPMFSDRLQQELESTTSTAVEKVAADRLRQLLLKILRLYIKTECLTFTDAEEFRKRFGSYIGSLLHGGLVQPRDASLMTGSVYHASKQYSFSGQPSAPSSAIKTYPQKTIVFPSTRGECVAESSASKSAAPTLVPVPQLQVASSSSAEPAESSGASSHPLFVVRKVKMEPSGSSPSRM